MSYGEPIATDSHGSHFESCHVFQCDGTGCTAPPGYCDCDILDIYDLMSASIEESND